MLKQLIVASVVVAALSAPARADRDLEFEVILTIFLPFNHVSFPGDWCRSYGPQLYYKGDDRGFGPNGNSYRARQMITVIPESNVNAKGFKGGSAESLPGLSKSYASDALAHGVYGAIDPSDDDMDVNDCELLHEFALADPDDMHIDVERLNGQKVLVHLYGSLANPLHWAAPPADWDFEITIDTSGGVAKWTLEGGHDGFPPYEIYINDYWIYAYGAKGKQPWEIAKLFYDMDSLDKMSGTLP